MFSRSDKSKFKQQASGVSGSKKAFGSSASKLDKEESGKGFLDVKLKGNTNYEDPNLQDLLSVQVNEKYAAIGTFDDPKA
eukprot:gene28567-35428_t